MISLNDLNNWRSKLDEIDLTYGGPRIGPGRGRDVIRHVLEDSGKKYLSGKGHRPPLHIAKIQSLIKSEFDGDLRLARRVSKLLGRITSGVKKVDKHQILTAAMVRDWLDLARRWLNALEDIVKAGMRAAQL